MYGGSQLFAEFLITVSILPFTVFCSTSLFIISCHGNDPFLRNSRMIFAPRIEIRVIFLDTKEINVEERLNRHVHTTGE